MQIVSKKDNLWPNGKPDFYRNYPYYNTGTCRCYRERASLYPYRYAISGNLYHIAARLPYQERYPAKMF